MASKMMELDICGLYLAEPQRKSLAMAGVIARDVICLSGSCSLAVRILIFFPPACGEGMYWISNTWYLRYF